MKWQLLWCRRQINCSHVSWYYRYFLLKYLLAKFTSIFQQSINLYDDHSLNGFLKKILTFIIYSLNKLTKYKNIYLKLTIYFTEKKKKQTNKLSNNKKVQSRSHTYNSVSWYTCASVGTFISRLSFKK